MKSNDMVTQFMDSSDLICIYEFCPGVSLDMDDRQQVVFVYKNNDFADVYAYHLDIFRNELAQAQLDLQQFGIYIDYSLVPSLDFYSRVLYPQCDLNKEFFTIVKQTPFKKFIYHVLCKFEYEINPQLSFYEELNNMRIIRASEYACLGVSTESGIVSYAPQSN